MIICVLVQWKLYILWWIVSVKCESVFLTLSHISAATQDLEVMIKMQILLVYLLVYDGLQNDEGLLYL